MGAIDPSTPQFLKSYMEGLKSSYHFGWDAVLYLGPAVGFGIKYSYFNTKGDVVPITVYIPNNNTPINGNF